MSRIHVASVAAAALLTTTLGAQTQSATGAATQPAAAPGRVTVTGCVERADQMNSAGGNLGTTVDSLDFVLMKAKDGPASAASSSSANAASTTGTSGAAVGPMYRLQADVNKLNPHVGHRVEIVGTREAVSPGQSADPASPNAASAPRLQVESVKMISETCGR